MRTIDGKGKEKSVTIVDKRQDKNDAINGNGRNTINNKSVDKNSILSNDKPTPKLSEKAKSISIEKPKLNIPEQVVIKPIDKENKSVSKPDSKPTVTPKSDTKVSTSVKTTDKSEDKTMATKPPMPIEKTPSKVRLKLTLFRHFKFFFKCD